MRDLFNMSQSQQVTKSHVTKVWISGKPVIRDWGIRLSRYPDFQIPGSPGDLVTCYGELV